MVRYTVLRTAMNRLPDDVMRHMGNFGGQCWLTERACKEIAEDPSISTDDKQGVFWLQVNHGNTAHFRFAYSLYCDVSGLPGSLVQVENVLTRAIVWKYPS
jgi:hypothetical protein